jgi:hypothetical protein
VDPHKNAKGHLESANDAEECGVTRGTSIAMAELARMLDVFTVQGEERSRGRTLHRHSVPAVGARLVRLAHKSRFDGADESGVSADIFDVTR